MVLYLIYRVELDDPLKGSFDPQRGCNPQVENHCSTEKWKKMVMRFLL